MRVMICEDNALIAMDLREMVEEAGHEALGTATTSDICFERAYALQADLVLVDLNLADGRTGPALIKRLAGEGIPSIVVSGELDYLPEDHGALALLEKPVSYVSLRDTLSRHDRSAKT
jgi:two-component system, response regulator PdtaR